jgi:hypothetical protein
VVNERASRSHLIAVTGVKMTDEGFTPKSGIDNPQTAVSLTLVFLTKRRLDSA